MKMIHTVLGKINPDALGLTQCHEHLFITKGQSYLCSSDLCIDDLQKSVQEARRFYSGGGRAVVDAQPVGCNRDARALAEISKESSVHIVMSTGFHKMQFYPEGHWIASLCEDRLAELFTEELTRGAYMGTDTYFHPVRQNVRAGIIKTALDACNLQQPYERLFRAASQAQKTTGATMMVHIEKGSNPEALMKYLTGLGVSPDRLYFCHMDRACDRIGIFQSVLQAGITLEFDTIARYKYHSNEYELELLKKLLDKGFEDLLLISLDTTRARLKAYGESAVGLDYIIKDFVPMMREAGISERQIEKMLILNPKRILSW
ncbi:MAG: hypothetical protein VB064_11195 [Oscillospiraceae bacterium]|nr:hypothetical protein [Oscillospiraceae bacterium]